MKRGASNTNEYRQANPLMQNRLIQDPLVDADWLKARLGNESLRIMDASFKMPGTVPTAREDYAAAHLPGATFFDIDAIADRDTHLPHMFPDAAQFSRDIAALGVNADCEIVLYDSGSWMAAPRVWWMFRAFGYHDVRILDGGMKAWQAAHGEIVAAPTIPRATKADARFDSARFDPARIRSKSDLVANLESQAEQVVDARSRERFEGAVSEPWPGRVSGRIPGSFNVPFGDLIDAASGRMKPLAQLRVAFEQGGVDLARPIVTSCGSGVSAAVLNLALYRIGVQESALYDGSWAEWGLPGHVFDDGSGDLPIARG